MSHYDFRASRLYLDAALAAGSSLTLDAPRAHYLTNVLRLKAGARVLVFNGRDGEWLAEIVGSGKKSSLVVRQRTREQTAAGDLHYWFAPLKHARLDYLVQKAVEMGVSCLQPVITRHTQAARVNLERMQGNVIEAAEQCGILTLPSVQSPLSLDRAVAEHNVSRLLIFCDEDAEVRDPIAALQAAQQAGNGEKGITLLVGPEGGFAEVERAALLQRPNVLRLALGPRILRADTAAVAAMALVQAVLGDWQ